MSQSLVQSRPSVGDGINRGVYNIAENSRNDYNGRRPSTLSPNLSASTGGENRDGGQEPPNQHLLYLTACLIGQLVEVQVKNGSIYSGVFHTASAEKDYGIVLKIARLTRNGLSRGKNDLSKNSTKRPVKTLLIQAKDLVQINAKDISVSAEVPQNGRARENRAEIVTDSFLSQCKHVDVERELKPWMPDNEDHKDLGLDSTFQNTWHRNWDQFEINKALFGVESTFDEELYTTKLDRGPQSREWEREAWRIAREIEAESTQKNHAEEDRNASDDFDPLEEESKFSSVLRSSEDVEDSKTTNSNSCNNEESSRFSRLATVASTRGIDPENCAEAESRESDKLDSNKHKDVDLLPSTMDVKVSVAHKEKLLPAVGEDSNNRVMKVGSLKSPAASMVVGDATSIQALNLDCGYSQVTEDIYRDFNEFKQQENAKRGKKQREDQVNALKSFSESLKDFAAKPQTTVITGSNCKMSVTQTSSASSLALSTSINASNPVVGSDTPNLIGSSRSLSSASSEGLIRLSSNEASNFAEFSQVEALVNNHSPQLETSNMPLNPIPSMTTPSSPSSSSGADSYRMSSLNPNAKEFKFNPNAKSFIPSFASPRPHSPSVQAPAYFPGVTPPTGQIPNIPSAVGASSMLQPGGQSAAKYTSYNPVAVAPAPGSNPYLPSPGTYIPGAAVTGAAVSHGQSAMKVPPQLQQPALAGQTYGSQQPIRYTSQAPSVHSTSTYLHPNGQMYSQQMMFGQPGQVVYIQPYTQAAPIPQPPSTQSPSHQPQPKHRAPGAGVQGVQLCVAPPFIAAQQHFLPQVQVPQLSNPLQSTPGVLVPTTMSGIQPPQGVIGGIVTPQQNAGTSMMRVGGKFVGMNYHQ